MISNESISVVVPTYNRSDALKRAIRSIYQQTIQPFEVIVVDDGSTDDTANMVAQSFPEVIYVPLEKNSNASVARNRGVDMASGSHIAFLDSDDKRDPEHLEVAMISMSERPEIDLLATSFRVCSGNGLERVISFNSAAVKDIVSQLLNGTVDARSSTLVCTRSLASQVRFDEQLGKHQDWDFAARCAAVGNVFTSASVTVRIVISGNGRMSGKPNHFASDLFYRKHGTMMSPQAKARFFMKRAEVTLRDEGRSQTFTAYLRQSLPPFGSLRWQDLVKLASLVTPFGLSTLDIMRTLRDRSW